MDNMGQARVHRVLVGEKGNNMAYVEHIAGSLVTEIEAASILRISLTSLRRWRRQGTGPVYRKLNKAVRYRPEDLTDFIASARRTSTAGAA